MRLPRKTTSGQTLIEILIGIAIFSILANAVFTLVSSSYRFTSFNRARITARHLAQEKMELIKNLPFDDVGTIGGVPNKPYIQQEETVKRNGLNFLINTAIIYVDDDFDGTLGGVPEDLLPTDYKRVRIEVSWEGLGASRGNPVVLVTDIVPDGLESTAGGGTISVLVLAQGEPVGQADVTIVSSGLTPEINLTQSTGNNGRILLPGAPTCSTCYRVTVTKTGYSTVRTYSTSEVANPDDPDLTVSEGDVVEIILSIDLVSTLNIASYNDRDSGFTPFPNAAFHMQGTKTIGTDALGEPVYKYDEDLSTDTSGLLTISDLEGDNYEVTIDSSLGDLSGINPIPPIEVIAGSTQNLSFALSSHTQNSLLLTFEDTSQNLVSSVSATLTDGGVYNETILSGDPGNPDFGQAFFSGLSPTTYTLTATASGFLDSTGSVPVDGQTFETILLTPQ